ncbi:DUF1648 domain-containing protein [Peribacillus sp. NPDC097224]|uniref:DUF1648 domain-containing protein n=1 Tax=Peribacillus sp. NPDC097224 TaxID=3364399 RepID=UPI0037F24D40
MVTNKKTAIERSLDLASMILLIIIFVYIWFKWSALPDSIPMKFDSSGLVSQWGDKKSILGLPLIGLAAYGVFSLVEKFPDNINLRIYKRENKEKELKYNRTIVNAIKNAIVIVLVLANWQIIEGLYKING